MDRRSNESMQQYRGRQKRELNAANDALGLIEGEPVSIGSTKIRFHDRLIDRMRPSSIIRLEGKSLSDFLAKEADAKARADQNARDREAREAFYMRQDVRDADSVRYILEDRLSEVIDRLTPSEWGSLYNKLRS